MKKLKSILLTAGAALLLSSCGVNSAIILNHNQNATHVQLSSNNFKVVDKVSGSSSVYYVLMIGGLTKKQLYDNAYSMMLEKAKLMNTSRAIVNVVTEEHIGGVPPFYFKRTVTVSANVIEFNR